jgi:hypothetical protein
MKAIREGTVPLDLHRGLEAHEMNGRPRIWGTIDDERCTWKMKDVAFGGILALLENELAPLSTWMLAFKA